MQEERCRDNRGRSMPRSHTYAGKDPTEYECFKFRRVLERKKYAYDI